MYVYTCMFQCMFCFAMLCMDVLNVYCMHIYVCIYVYVYWYVCMYACAHICLSLCMSWQEGGGGGEGGVSEGCCCDLNKKSTRGMCHFLV